MDFDNEIQNSKMNAKVNRPKDASLAGEDAIRAFHYMLKQCWAVFVQTCGTTAAETILG
jgi:hypothetical protein